MASKKCPPNGKRDYDFGYGRPPKHTRWPKGKSGNPNGPRKGSRALKTDLDEALRATLTITVGGKKRRGTTQGLTMYALAIKSATGDLRAAKLLADLVLTVFGPGDRGGAAAKLSRQDEELLARLLERFDPEADTQSQADDDPTSDEDDAGDAEIDDKGDGDS
jgi:hypothetical protein